MDFFLKFENLTGNFIQHHNHRLLHQRAFRANCQPNSHFARLEVPIRKLKN